MLPLSHRVRMGALAAALLLGLSACGQTPASSAASTAAAPAQAQHAYAIHGHLPALKDGTEVKLLAPVLAADPMKMEPLATAKAKDGRFVLDGEVAQPIPAVLTLGEHGTVKLILEAGELRIEQGALGPVARGGRLNARVLGYLEQPEYVAAEQAKRAANRAAFDGVDMEDEAAMKAARQATEAPMRKVSELKNAYDRRILDGDEPALLKLLVLADNYDWKHYDEARRAQMMAGFRRELGDHPSILSYERATAAYEKSQQLAAKFGVGKPYADIEAVDVEGKRVKLSEALAKNKLVMLDFWASWCGPCRGEFPHLLKVYREFHAQGFEIYAVSLDEDKADWTKAMREEGGKDSLPWLNLQDPGFEGKAAQTYGVLGLPQNYLIAANGEILGGGMREWDIERAVRAHIGGKGGDAH